MSRLYHAGCEIETSSVNADIPDGVCTATQTTRDTATFRSGAASWKFDSGAGNVVARCSSNTTAGTTTSGSDYVRVYFRAAAAPGTDCDIIDTQSATAGPRVKFLTTGAIQLYMDTGAVGSASASTINDSAWHRIEISLTLDASNLIVGSELRLDGVTVGTYTGSTAISGGAWRWGWCSVPGANKVLNADDVAINSSAGASNNTWCGAGAVLLLKPISDNARGTGWVNDANAASGFFDATDNTPPAGIADTVASTGLHQIRNGTSNANSNVDLNMTSYTTAGIGAGGTVNAIIPWTSTGAPVTTGAKQGTVGVVSNPAITNVALSITGTSGAFWSGVTAGTYPTGWKWSPGTMTNAPSVTLGTSPVMRITQVTSSTRIAMVCAMFLYVEYTPAVVVTFVPRSPGVDSGFGHF